MIFSPIPAKDIEDFAWPWFSEAIAPAVRQQPNVTMQQIYLSLINGHDLAIQISGADAKGAMILQVTPEGICWVKYLSGKTTGTFKTKIKTMRDGIAWIERAAANAGCHEVRVCGRDWHRILNEYEKIVSVEPNSLRKVITMKEAA